MPQKDFPAHGVHYRAKFLKCGPKFIFFEIQYFLTFNVMQFFPKLLNKSIFYVSNIKLSVQMD